MRKTLHLALAATLLLSAEALSAQEVLAPTAQGRIALDPAQFDKYAGYYQPGSQAVVRFYREDSHYYFNTVGTQQKMEIFAEAPDRFSPGDRPLKFTFHAGPDGIATELMVNAGGREMTAPRITEEAANALIAARTPTAPAVRNWAVRIAPHRIVTSMSGDSVDYWPAFTSDGRRIIFARTSDAGKTWALVQIPVAGGDVRPLFERAGVPVTRANAGAKGLLVFQVGRAVWIMNEDGTRPREVPLKDILIPAYPSLYPDGKSVVVTDLARSTLNRVDVVTGVATPLTRESEVLTGMSSVSPDGRWVAFAGQRNHGQGDSQRDNQIWLVDESGFSRAMEANPASGRTPNWSPDGKRIAFESTRGSPDDHYALFIMNRDGSGLTQITDYALNGNHPVWSPDGKHLAFSWGSEPGRPNGIAVIDVAN